MLEYMKKNKSKILIWLLSYIFVFVGGLFLSATIACVKNHLTVNLNNIFLMFDNSLNIILGLTSLFIFLLIGWNVYYYTVLYKKMNEVNISHNNQDFYGGAKFLINQNNKITSKELKSFENVYPKNPNEIGWVVKAIYNSKTNKVDYNVSCLKSGHHLLIIGATSTGKTQKTILHSIAYNSSINELNKKPSMVIFDPKG